ncbi:gas vesicle protein GvpG [Fictibacillus sp. KU28468]|uniref:gas vesicle protein GvpG n=1 Tax=Fictibacillus sp. KU28468 TaxID=2991053 RepID=UPI00223D4EB4|nr:gas vesicle protein GvpG [Fictibacillus sp. KU28468]UZJ79590.1 gas vesicle protein GvpG [Fictibacillus sp. KU28468]
MISILLFPLKLLLMTAEKVKEEADRELYDVGIIQKKLLMLEVSYENGELAKEEFDQQYLQWLCRYEDAREKERNAWTDWIECTSNSENAIE